MDCPVCGTFNSMKAQRCDCGYRFPTAVSALERHEKVRNAPARIDNADELENVLAELDASNKPLPKSKARPRPSLVERSEEPPRTATVQNDQERADEAAETVVKIAAGIVIARMAAYILVGLLVLIGIFAFPIPTIAACAVAAVYIYYRRSKRRL